MPRVTLSRREIFGFGTAAMAGWSRLCASGPDFWDNKPPSEWTSDEIEKLTTKSPWAKEVSAQMERSGDDGSGGRGGGVGGPRVGVGIPGIGIGGPRMGGGRMPGGRGGGRQMQAVKGTVRWESAQPILDALKTPLPEDFANHYVISVNGLPLRGGRRSQDDGDSAEPSEKMLDNLKAYTSLQPNGKPMAQPGIVRSQNGAVLFGFAKDMLDLSADDKQAAFSTQFGRMQIQTKFEMKDMKYRGKLAL
jgi:hypothetical protein